LCDLCVKLAACLLMMSLVGDQNKKTGKMSTTYDELATVLVRENLSGTTYPRDKILVLKAKKKR